MEPYAPVMYPIHHEVNCVVPILGKYNAVKVDHHLRVGLALLSWPNRCEFQGELLRPRHNRVGIRVHNLYLDCVLTVPHLHQVCGPSSSHHTMTVLDRYFRGSNVTELPENIEFPRRIHLCVIRD